MEQIYEVLQLLNAKISGFIWGPPMLVLFLFTGLYFSAGTRFFQWKHKKLWFGETLISSFRSRKKSSKDEAGSITQWQALTTALASTCGTGNIAGVATAITAGGPGAIFWMWVSAFLGMMTHYAETVLGMHFRRRDQDGAWMGGPMIYMEQGLHCRWMACLFSLFCIIAALGIGNMSQANSLAIALNDSFGFSRLITGIITAILVGMVILGGVKRIASVCEKLVPFMAAFYTIGALIVIFSHITNLPAALFSIFSEAFRWQSVGGGVLGYGISAALKTGVSRGVFSNEAGLGSSVIVHASSNAAEPVVQGMWGILEVFLDTIVMCTITALAILCSGVYDSSSYLYALVADRQNGNSLLFDSLPNGVTLTANAFTASFGPAGGLFVSVSIVLFAFCTLVGWSIYGEKCLAYLTNKRGIALYKLVYAAFIVVGAVCSLDFVWSISDTFNGLMALPNLFAILLLSPLVFKITRDYLKRKFK